jgi:exosome complex component RRP4
MDYLPALGTFRENDQIISSRIGLINIDGRLIKVIPLSGRYVPKVGDIVIGRITNISFYGWSVDIGYAYEASLFVKEATSEYISKSADLSQYYNFNDIIVAKVINVTKSKVVDLTTKGPGLKRIKESRMIKVTPSKVPRIIGKQGSMISLVKNATNCKIMVGQNGRVLIQGDDPEKERLAEEIILKIDREAHKEGLTDEIKKFIEGKNDLHKKV